MKYRLQVYYPAAGDFMDTNHQSDDLSELKRIAMTDTFLGFRIRILDDLDALRFAPPVRERMGDTSVADIAAMLDVPMLPPLFLSPDEMDDDDDEDQDENRNS